MCARSLTVAHRERIAADQVPLGDRVPLEDRKQQEPLDPDLKPPTPLQLMMTTIQQTLGQSEVAVGVGRHATAMKRPPPPQERANLGTVEVALDQLPGLRLLASLSLQAGLGCPCHLCPSLLSVQKVKNSTLTYVTVLLPEAMYNAYTCTFIVGLIYISVE